MFNNCFAAYKHIECKSYIVVSVCYFIAKYAKLTNCFVIYLLHVGWHKSGNDMFLILCSNVSVGY